MEGWREHLQAIGHELEPVAPLCIEIISNADNRYWYQLGLRLYELMEHPCTMGRRCDIYHSIVAVFADDIDLVQLAKIIELAARGDFASPAEAAEYLIGSLSVLEKSKTATEWMKLQIVDRNIESGEIELAIVRLSEMEQIMDHTVDISVRSLFYQVLSKLDWARDDFDACYKDTLIYLSTSGETHNVAIARILCVSALCSKGVFSFGELANHSITKSLEGEDDEWLMKLVLLMDRGTPDISQEFDDEYLGFIRSHDYFSQYTDLIAMKVKLCVLQELIFQRKQGESRVFSFEDVARDCSIDISDVEHLVLKALANNLIHGFIDEVEQRFVVTWCKTKTLSNERLRHLKGEIDEWIKKVHDNKILMEKLSQPVIG